jgi:hypothetical protein
LKYPVDFVLDTSMEEEKVRPWLPRNQKLSGAEMAPVPGIMFMFPSTVFSPLLGPKAWQTRAKILFRKGNPFQERLAGRGSQMHTVEGKAV